MSVSPDSTAMLTIGTGALTPDLLAELLALGATVTPALDEPLVIDLAKPIEGPGGVTVAQLVIVEPTAAQIMLWDKAAGVEADAIAIAAVAGIPRSVVDKLPARPFYQAARRIGAFLA